jgi:benzoate-CoA ligase
MSKHIRMTTSRYYNAAADLLQRNLDAGRAEKIAYIDDQGSYTFGELAARAGRFADGLKRLGIAPEQRILLALRDSIDFPTAFLGAIQAGVVPVCVNTLLTTHDYGFMLQDSRAQVLVVSEALLPMFAAIIETAAPHLKWVVVSGEQKPGRLTFATLLAESIIEESFAATTADEMCFWLYSSGSTGAPKGTVHAHSSLMQTADLYAKPILGIREHDVVFSAAKLFFAYGLGNGLSFPMSVGATTVLMAERPTPAAVFARLTKFKPTIFYGVPTLYAAMLASPDLPPRQALQLRCCTSAGEALPKELGERWQRHFGVDILDGIGSTEMLHIFISNEPNNVRYGTTGEVVPGYQIRIVDEHGNAVKSGEIGDMHVKGPTRAILYWNNRDRSQQTFAGEWTKSGDKYRQDEAGYYIYCGRSDDMLKVSGQYVSPMEVEAALATHDAVLEAAVVGKFDEDKLIKPKAFVVLKSVASLNDGLEEVLKQHVKNKLAPFKYPRWIEFVSELPKTATGKIQRFKLRT